MSTNELKIKTKKTGESINLRQYGMMLALIGIFVVFTIATKGTLFFPDNFNNLVMQNSYVVILACGMVLCVLTGNVDLSVGSVTAFVGAVSASLMVRQNIPVWAAIICALLIGLMVGAFQGFFIAYIKIPAFIVTLADMLIFRGLTMVVLAGQTVGPLDASYRKIAAGYLPTLFVKFSTLEWHMFGKTFRTGGLKIDMVSIIVGIIAAVVIVFLEINNRRTKKKYNFKVTSVSQSAIKVIIIAAIANIFTFKLGSSAGLPIVLVILVITILIYSFITQNTVAGRHIYAYGGNAKAAQLSGIKTQRVMFWVYVSMGLMCAIAGIVLSSRNGSATPKAGDGFELDAMASCYIGGASTTGGIGTVIGAVVGAMIMGVLNMGMSLLGWSVDWQKVVKGAVLLGAVTFDLISKRKSTK